jgi:hypothetical protein
MHRWRDYGSTNPSPGFHRKAIFLGDFHETGRRRARNAGHITIFFDLFSPDSGVPDVIVENPH